MSQCGDAMSAYACHWGLNICTHCVLCLSLGDSSQCRAWKWTEQSRLISMPRSVASSNWRCLDEDALHGENLIVRLEITEKEAFQDAAENSARSVVNLGTRAITSGRGKGATRGGSTYSVSKALEPQLMVHLHVDFNHWKIYSSPAKIGW
jgi:hypothetical protein